MMDEDELWKGIARVARERKLREDIPVSPDEVLAAGADPDEVLAPFDERVRAEMLLAALSGLETEDDEANGSGGDLFEAAVASASDGDGTREGVVVPLRVVSEETIRTSGAASQPVPSSRRRWGTWGAALALAAVLLIFVLPHASGPVRPISADYTVEVLRGGKTDRSNDGVPILAPRRMLELVARPSSDVRGELTAQVWLVRGDTWEPVLADHEVSPRGSVRVSLRYRGERLSGPARMVVIVARPGLLPSAPQEAARAADGEGIRVMALPVRPGP